VLTLKLQPWLYRVTLHVYTHYARGARLQLLPLDASNEQQAQAIQESEDERPEMLFELRERRQEIAALVSRLPECYRIAIACYYFEDLTYHEIAELLNQPVGTVKSSISRGIRLLRLQLATSNLAPASARESPTWSNNRTDRHQT
jgi:RNA polymerase sigma-70 factor (ECF subfamily)